MKRAGVFDPWRQVPEEAEARPAPKLRQAESAMPVRRCVTFPSRNCGLNVWVEAGSAEEASQKARDVLVMLVHWLYQHQPVAAQILHGRGVYTQDVGSPNAASIQDAQGRSIYLNPPDGMPLTQLVYALRELQYHSDAACRMMAQYNVKPYVS